MGPSLATLVVLVAPGPAGMNVAVFEGTWVTTNRRMEGTLSCVVTDLGGGHWRGHFQGAYQGTPFSYMVDFTDPADNLRGTAVIDGADYQWTGAIGPGAPGWFKGSFTGNRYIGGFDLKQKGR
jgi:hypothetical protein